LSLLEIAGVDVHFGGLKALRGVDLRADAGTVTGLIGPNGAGKTTLFNVICGLLEPDRGTVALDGTDLGGRPAFRRARLGVARTFQRLEVFGSLSARDNVLVSAEVHRSWSHQHYDPGAVADSILERVGIAHVAGEQVDSLSTGIARLVELARALATQPKILLLDEPSSGLDEDESADFGRLLVELTSQGLGVLLVEHDIELVMSVCSVIHVLDFGAILAVGTPKEIQADEKVRAAYLGIQGEVDLAVPAAG
jgi:branched-chain amino acid transport system ATP-binding protein